MESDIRVNGLTDSSHESLEGSLEEQHVSCFLVSLDLSECNSTWSESVLSLHSTFSRSCLLLGLAVHLALGATTSLGG